jgi:hypothetical protein
MFAYQTLRSPTLTRPRHRRGSRPAPLHRDTGAPRRRRWALGRRAAIDPVGPTRDGLSLGPAWQISALRTLYGA